MIPDAHAWCRLPDRGQQVLRRLYQELTEWRDDLAVILIRKAGRLFRPTLPGHVRGVGDSWPAYDRARSTWNVSLDAVRSAGACWQWRGWIAADSQRMLVRG